MDEAEIDDIQAKIDAGILLAQKKLVEDAKLRDRELVIERDGEIVHVPASTLEEPDEPEALDEPEKLNEPEGPKTPEEL